LAKESERFFEILLRDISESVFVIRNRKIFWCNRGSEQVLGYSRKELIGHSPARFFPSKKTFRDFSMKAYRALAHRNRYDVVTALKCKSGGILNMELSLSVIRRTDGRVTEVVTVGRDITARIKTERESKERKRRLTILNKVTAKISSSIQLKHVLLYSAKSILKLTGLDSCSIVLYDEATSSLQDYISIGFSKLFQKSLKWRLRRGGVTEWVVKQKKPLVIPDTIKDLRSAGSRATKEAGVRALVAVPILSKSKVIGLIVVNSYSPGRVSSDVVSLISSIASQAAGAIENAKLYKQVSQKVNELSALHLVGNTLVSSLDVTDLLGEVVTVLGKSFGYNYCSILPLDRKKMELTIGAAHGVPQRTIRNLRINAAEGGITGWVARTGKPLYVPDVHQDSRYLSGIKGIKSELAVPLKRGKEIIGVLDVESKEANGFGDRDLRVLTTVAAQMAMAIENAKLFEKAKRAYKDLKAAQANVVQAGKMAAVGQLAAGIAHELNNPIGGIMGYAQFALKKMQLIDVTEEHEEEIAQLERYLGYIERESQRCKNIVQNLLNFSRTSPLGYQPTDVNHVIRESFQFLEHELTLNNIVVSKTLSKRLPLIMGNENQLQQVFLNMIMNAHKAMPHQGTLTVTTRRVKDDERCKDYVEVVFSDTGCGIAQEHIDRIFEPFFTTRKIGEGTGLGLSVSYRIVKNHGGEILVNSKIDQGSTFVVRLPVNHKPRETKPKTDVET
jgi:PAS domain S-box-containing protein